MQNFVNPFNTSCNPTSSFAQNAFMGDYSPFGSFAGNSMNVTNVPTTESRANIGYPQTNTGFPNPFQQQNQQNQPQCPLYNPQANQNMSSYSPTYAYDYTNYSTMDQLAYMNQMQQTTCQPIQGYNGYPIGVDPNNYIYEYMRNNTAPKNPWGANYWNTPKPVEQPPIDWTQKAQPQVGDYSQYGMNGVQCQQPQPMLPNNFGFAPAQESWLSIAQKNWKSCL